VFGLFHRSREADFVVWDSQNYPSIPFLQHSHFLRSRFVSFLRRNRAIPRQSYRTCWQSVELSAILCRITTTTSTIRLR
jgi:hypothetical protein